LKTFYFDPENTKRAELRLGIQRISKKNHDEEEEDKEPQEKNPEKRIQCVSQAK